MADGDNANDRFLYASTPSAGLHLLLTMWPQIRQRLPTARLDVYYGFWPYAMWNEQAHLVRLRKQIEPLLEQDGVHYHGMRSETDLALAYAAAGFYAYPTDKAETSGIALMKAQSCGCIPVTSGQMTSATPETCGEFDLGPPGRPGKYITYESEWQQDFLHALLRAAARPPAELAALRARMKASARQRFSWARVAEQWSGLFRNATRPPTGGEHTTSPPPPSSRRAPSPTPTRTRTRPSRSPPSPPPPLPPAASPLPSSATPSPPDVTSAQGSRGTPSCDDLDDLAEADGVVEEVQSEEQGEEERAIAQRTVAAAARLADIRRELEAQRVERERLLKRVRARCDSA